jgi:hypothetical protein
MSYSHARAALLAAPMLLVAAPMARAHGFAGSRFFPATLTIDDPFVADELSLPTISQMKEDDVTETEYAFEFSKRITKDLGLSIEDGYSHLHGGGVDANGFGNIETTLKYQLVKDDQGEGILSAGLSVEWGGAGAEQVEAERQNTFTPTVYFGKGFGAWSKDTDWWRAFAVTGVAGYAIPDRAKTGSLPDIEHHVPSFELGAALEYSLPYLHANVQDIGLPQWANQITPLVEVSASIPQSDRFGDRATGTINPGLIWSGQQMQVSAEAVFPMNGDSGKTIGVAVQLHFYLDDIFPQSIGKPLMGEGR